MPECGRETVNPPVKMHRAEAGPLARAPSHAVLYLRMSLSMVAVDIDCVVELPVTFGAGRSVARVTMKTSLGQGFDRANEPHY